MRECVEREGEGMKKLKEKEKPGIGEGILLLLACVASYTLHCRFEVVVGGYPDSMLMNGLDKLLITFTKPQFTDIVVAAAVYMALRYVKRSESPWGISGFVADNGFYTGGGDQFLQI